MKIIQLSDFHLRGDGKLSFRVADTPKMAEACFAHLAALPWRPDAYVITGDLADGGDLGAYQQLKQFLDRLEAPVYLLPGNHDKRDRILSVLPDYCPADPAVAPYLCYTVEGHAMRLVFLDGTRPGSHSGHCDEPVALWLERELAKAPDAPTLLFTHHPPFLCGFGKMDEPYENQERLAAILRSYPKVRLCCGHMHRSITTQWAGCIAVTAPAVAMQIEIDLTPEGGDEFRMETPGYLLHHFHAGVCNTHTCQIFTHATFSGPHRFYDSVNPV
jgi:3',5'-cyclic AMP phosphodiesterase CpdA